MSHRMHPLAYFCCWTVSKSCIKMVLHYLVFFQLVLLFYLLFVFENCLLESVSWVSEGGCCTPEGSFAGLVLNYTNVTRMLRHLSGTSALAASTRYLFSFHFSICFFVSSPLFFLQSAIVFADLSHALRYPSSFLPQVWMNFLLLFCRISMLWLYTSGFWIEKYILFDWLLTQFFSFGSIFRRNGRFCWVICQGLVLLF